MKDLGNLQRMLKQAKEMQDRLQEELAELRIEGTSGGGIVRLTLDGQKNLVSVRLEPEVINPNDIEMLQDLIVAAFNDASAKVDEQVAQKLGALGGGLKIPGLF
jgi:DNA-binding YbaB/EbfC family protein